ncbi:MAG: LysR substrate-binding domain-containing protein [bacterium]
MKRKLPPLNALVAFEAAARHRSFTKAGDELCVTPSAISHQVRQLEEWLGLRLFERRARAVEMTDAGARCLREAGAMFDRLERFCNDETAWRKNATTITLQTTDSFAARWLAPRLTQFEARCPDIILRIVTHDFRESLREAEADIGILFVADAVDEDARNHSRLLFAEEIFPVCSPKLLRDNKSVGIADLREFALIHDDNVGVSWSEWIASADGERVIGDAGNGARYNHAHLALQAAELGNGLVLASNVLTSDALARGVLVAPFAHKIITGRGYCLAQSSNAQTRETCRPFAEWILSECQADAVTPNSSAAPPT